MNHYLSIFLFLLFLSCQDIKEEYICKPCNLPCDTLIFDSPGICPHCRMRLIKKSDWLEANNLQVNDINIQLGSGAFLIEGGKGKKDKPIKIYYHQPKEFSPNSKILIVIPGAGRSGESYRDAWVNSSEKYNVLVLTPTYPEETYPFEQYHLCGIVDTSNLKKAVRRVTNTNIAQLDESIFEYKLNTDKETWLFNDFDRLFDLVVQSLNSNQKQYDIFGHSAGGQILHRMAIFSPNSKVNKIVAANSGFYTIPNLNIDFPFGLKNTSFEMEQLSYSFTTPLLILVGELDNKNEKGGTLLRSPTVDEQGLHRLERAHYFFAETQRIAEEMKGDFNWKMKVVPHVGHNHREMSKVAALYLHNQINKKILNE